MHDADDVSTLGVDDSSDCTDGELVDLVTTKATYRYRFDECVNGTYIMLLHCVVVVCLCAFFDNHGFNDCNWKCLLKVDPLKLQIDFF